jgi:hypothetical protein
MAGKGHSLAVYPEAELIGLGLELLK